MHKWYHTMGCRSSSPGWADRTSQSVFVGPGTRDGWTGIIDSEATTRIVPTSPCQTSTGLELRYYFVQLLYNHLLTVLRLRRWYLLQDWRAVPKIVEGFTSRVYFVQTRLLCVYPTIRDSTSAIIHSFHTCLQVQHHLLVSQSSQLILSPSVPHIPTASSLFVRQHRRNGHQQWSHQM